MPGAFRTKGAIVDPDTKKNLISLNSEANVLSKEAQEMEKKR